MGWSGSLTASSAVGSSITFSSDTTTEGAYTTGSFVAPIAGVYKFVLNGSGGATGGPSWENARGAGGKGGQTVGYLNMTAGQTVYVGVGGYSSAAFVSKVSASTLAATSSASNLWFVAGAGGGGGANWGQQWGMKAGAGGAGGGSSGGGGGSGYIHASTLSTPMATYTNTTIQGGGAGANSTGWVKVTYYASADLPIVYNGTRLTKIIYNGVEITSLYYNGTKIF